MPGYFSLAALIITGAIALASPFSRGRSLLDAYARHLFSLSVLSIFSLASYVAFRQYEVWLNDPLARFLLPPYQDFSYFLFYSFTNFFAPYLISLFIALLLLVATAVINRKQGIFFEKEESYLAALSLFLVSHPGWIIYLVLLLTAYLVFHLAYWLTDRQSRRLPLYNFWVPTAFFAILINEYLLANSSWWSLLSF